MRVRHITILVLIFTVFFPLSSYPEIIRSTLEVATTRHSNDTYEYAAWVEAVGPSVKTLRMGYLKTPKKFFELKKITDDTIKDTFTFNSYDDLLNAFPQGNYLLLLQGPISRVRLLFSFDKPQFPPYPKILSPADYETNVELTPTISWLNVEDGEYGVTIYKVSPWEIVFLEWFSKPVTSFTVPDNILEPNTWYEVEVGIRNVPGLNGHAFYRVQFETTNE